jgi:hypothetical protein
VRTILREQFGVEVEADWGVYPGPDAAVDAEISRHKARWLPVELGRERAGDVCEFWQAGVAHHVGLVIRAGLVIHVSETQNTQAQPIAVARRITPLAGIWRHPDLARAGPRPRPPVRLPR